MLYEYISSNINYGFVSQDKNIFQRNLIDNDTYLRNLFNNYYLQSPKELLQSKCGICYDQVELANLWLVTHGYEILNCFTEVHNHSMVLFKKNDRYYWLETTLINHMGIHEYISLDMFYKDLLKIQKQKTMDIYFFNKIKYGCDFDTYKNNIINNNKKLILK